MKIGSRRYLAPIIFVALLCVFLVACEKEDAPEPQDKTFSCQLNGVDWNADELTIEIAREQKAPNVFANIMTLTSKRGDTSRMTLVVNDVRDALLKDGLSIDKYWGYDEVQADKNYFVEDGGIRYQNGASFALQANAFSDEASFLGEVTIDACEANKISGRFNFRIKHAVLDSIIYEVTNGVFTEQDFEFVE